MVRAAREERRVLSHEPARAASHELALAQIDAPLLRESARGERERVPEAGALRRSGGVADCVVVARDA